MTSNCLTAKDPILGIVPVYPAKYALAKECVVAWEGGSKLFPGKVGPRQRGKRMAGQMEAP